MLIIITVDHILTPEKSLLWQPLGYVSAASGFVFLAGVTTAIAYRRYIDQPRALWLKCWQRSLVIYLFHVSLLALYYGWQAIGMVTSSSFDNARETAVQMLFSLALIHQPSLMDILPMYVIFMMAAPWLLILISKGRPLAVLSASLLLWLLTQFMDIAALPGWLSQHDVRLGAFNPLAWQLLFVAGLVSGSVCTGRKKDVHSPFILAALAAPVLLLLLDRHEIIDIIPEHLLSLAERYSIGAIRLANFALLAALIYLSIRYFKLNIGNSWVEFLGRHSLQVFTYSILLAELSAKILPDIQQYSGKTGEIVYLTVCLISLSIPAFLNSRYRMRVKTGVAEKSNQMLEPENPLNRSLLASSRNPKG